MCIPDSARCVKALHKHRWYRVTSITNHETPFLSRCAAFVSIHFTFVIRGGATARLHPRWQKIPRPRGARFPAIPQGMGAHAQWTRYEV